MNFVSNGALEMGIHYATWVFIILYFDPLRTLSCSFDSLPPKRCTSNPLFFSCRIFYLFAVMSLKKCELYSLIGAWFRPFSASVDGSRTSMTPMSTVQVTSTLLFSLQGVHTCSFLWRCTYIRWYLYVKLRFFSFYPPSSC